MKLTKNQMAAEKRRYEILAKKKSKHMSISYGINAWNKLLHQGRLWVNRDYYKRTKELERECQ